MTRSGERIAIGLDVGGTSVDGAGVSELGQIIGNIIEADSPSAKTYDEIISELSGIINLANSAVGNRAVACGIGIPGPFDYEAGISHMKHKFQAINSRDIKTPLEQATGLPIYFVKDSTAFGLGAYRKQPRTVDRLLALTLGTGFGSSFVENGASVEDDSRVPADGEVWNLPHEDGILEDIVSARGISRIYHERTHEAATAKEVAHRARHGDAHAIATYEQLGQTIGRGLAPYYESFQPEKIVLGGKISQASDLFVPALRQELGPSTDESSFVIPAHDEKIAIVGAAIAAFDKTHI